MNKSIAILASLVVLGSAINSKAAVGVVNLSNYDTTPILGVDGTAVDAANTYISLLYSLNGSTWSTATTTSGATKWNPDDSSGYFDQGTGVLSSDAAKVTVSFQLVAWVGNTSYDVATVKGASAVWTQTTGSWDNTGTPPGAPDDVALQLPNQVKLEAVPEPSTIALGLLGAGALLIRRRK